MHRFVVGTCTMHIKITPKGPWMVRGETQEEYFYERGRQDRREYLTPLRDQHGNLLLPASSLKGVLRSTAERILRSMDPERDVQKIALADDPFIHDKERLLDLKRGQISDSELVEWNEITKHYPHDQLQPKTVYTMISPASQLFGCTLHAGLVTVNDATVKQRTQRRSHVAIDRFTGGVGEGPFLEHVVLSGVPLYTQLTIKNFALWHIGLLALVFQEINRGYVHVGAGTRNGQGQVQIDVAKVAFCYNTMVYDVDSGIISAQARLADAPWVSKDVPPAVVAVEKDKVLVRDVQRQERDTWRDAGAVHLVAQAAQVQQLFRESVIMAWREWIDQVLKEKK